MLVTQNSDCSRRKCRNTKTNFKAGQFWSHLRCGHATVPSLMFTTQVDSSASTTFISHGYTANRMQPNHFKPNLHLKNLCRSDCHADAAHESHLSTPCWLPSKNLMRKSLQNLQWGKTAEKKTNQQICIIYQFTSIKMVILISFPLLILMLLRCSYIAS